MKAIIYIRVSTSRQAEQGVSLENQEARLRQYTSMKGFTDVELIADEGLSGKTINRPGFQRMMLAVETRSVDAVVVYSLSRFARNTVATLEAISQMGKSNVTFHSLTEQVNTGSPLGRFFLAMLAALAELEREQISERTRAILQFLKANGKRVGQIPFGKRVAEGRLVNDDGEQEVIILVHHLRGKGETFAAIAQELVKRNIPNRSGKVRWSRQQAWRIFKSNQVLRN